MASGPQLDRAVLTATEVVKRCQVSILQCGADSTAGLDIDNVARMALEVLPCILTDKRTPVKQECVYPSSLLRCQAAPQPSFHIRLIRQRWERHALLLSLVGLVPASSALLLRRLLRRSTLLARSPQLLDVATQLSCADTLLPEEVLVVRSLRRRNSVHLLDMLNGRLVAQTRDAGRVEAGVRTGRCVGRHLS